MYSLRRILNRLFFFIGWILSPFTSWNDVFVNIPLAYLCASLFFKAFPVRFAVLVVIFYWATNVLGLLMMYIFGRGVIREKGIRLRSILVTLLIYSIILFLLDKIVVLRPIPVP